MRTVYLPAKIDVNVKPVLTSRKPGLQITVGHRTMVDQNLPMYDEIETLVGHFVQAIFCCSIWLYHLQIKFDFLIDYSFECTFVFTSDQTFLLSDQNGTLVGHMSFQGKKIICSPGKLSQILSVKENKPPIVNTQCVVYLFQCDLCDANYVGFTTRDLHQRIREHCYSAIGKHLETQHGNNRAKTNHLNFKVLKKCNSKIDCLVYGILYIKDIKPSLKTQADSIRA